MDVMDGHFVPNITIGAPVIKSLRKHTNVFLDCHLMVSNPEQWVKDFSQAGASQYNFHVEATNDISGLIKTIKESGMQPALAVKPKTPVDVVFPFVKSVNMVLIMTVEPGFGGQRFMADMMPKVEQLRKYERELHIQVDGGLGPDTIATAAQAGANVVVAGSSIFGHPGKYKEIISTLRSAVEEARPHWGT